ncbi:Outer membrane protein assembly factor BamB, contains PQQ-like beta-propeller repeat [Zobellia uliginosa]|uniref:Outer membrane protein assembly factor BamB, contains PQQ-like beta-propeller repeat n=1 Tax=Zobellia uliginosa TaxID=143224 RepID=A0ABY1KNN3_9FLAO|nr:PQQ-binding-like beta-propeller repeat protein [Zobellia uliginosa]SIS53908.1 Outer membrane protein assembly factor BamB, contains PQQ-like beta-propeller repeat [Zobellia uliginosa]
MKKQFLSRTIFWGIMLVFVAGCTTDDGVELNENGEVIDPEKGGQIVSGDPSLNDFVIAAKDETIYTVDAQTGEETVIYAFPDLTDFVGPADYNKGTIYVTSDDNSINALSVADRRFLWDRYMLEFNFGSMGTTRPICIDGVCYASGGSGVVVAVDEVTGTLKWYYTTDPNGKLDNVLNVNRTPVVYGDKVYVFSNKGYYSNVPAYLHILDKETGRLVQKQKLPYEPSGVPVFMENTMYLPAKNLYVIDLDTLNTLWMFEVNGVGTPFVSGDKLVVSAIPYGQSIGSVLYCLDKNTKSILWEVETGANSLWAPLIVGNVVFSNYDKGTSFPGATNANPFALDLRNGEELWKNEDVSVDFSPVYANGMLFTHGHDILRNNNDQNSVGLLAMDANTGEVLWLNSLFRFGSHIVPLVVADNGVFGPSYYRGK